MKLIAQLHREPSRCVPEGTIVPEAPVGETLPLFVAAGFGASFGRSGSPLFVGPYVPAVTTDGDTVTVAVSVATVSAMRRNRV